VIDGNRRVARLPANSTSDVGRAGLEPATNGFGWRSSARLVKVGYFSVLQGVWTQAKPKDIPRLHRPI
jgi:hypothetical protein